jgi:hypothetical protein
MKFKDYIDLCLDVNDFNSELLSDPIDSYFLLILTDFFYFTLEFLPALALLLLATDFSCFLLFLAF